MAIRWPWSKPEPEERPLPVTMFLCEALEDLEIEWAQGTYYISCKSLDIKVRVSNGAHNCQPDNYDLPQLDRERLWASVQTARANMLERKLEIADARMCECLHSSEAPLVRISLILENAHIEGYETENGTEPLSYGNETYHLMGQRLCTASVRTSGEVPTARVTCSKCRKTFKLPMSKLVWGHTA